MSSDSSDRDLISHRLRFTIRALLKLTTITALLIWMLWDSSGRFTISLSFVALIAVVFLVIEVARWLARKK